MIKDFAIFVGSLTGLEIGKNFHVGFSDNAPPRHVLLQEVPGGVPDTPTSLQTISMQVITSDIDHHAARELAYKVHDALLNRYNVILSPEWLLHGVVALDNPGYLGITEDGRHEWSSTYLVTASRR